MDWFYREGGKKFGPVSDSELESLLAGGKITAETAVWNETEGRWRPFGETHSVRTRYKPEENAGPAINSAAIPKKEETGSESPVHCSQCGGAFSPKDVVQYEGQAICASCKPLFFQKLKEGNPVLVDFIYGGFWIRFGARFIDGIIVGVGNMLFVMVPSSFTRSSEPFSPLNLMFLIFQYIVPIAYETYFVGKHGATPGKMICHLKIVRPDGEKLTYMRAFGRYFAQILNYLTLLVGFIMAAFDSEKRGLHDRICDTRVIRT